MDLSPLRKLEVLGPDAEALCRPRSRATSRRLAVGQVVYTAMCNDTGGMIDDGTVFRLGRRQLPLRRRRRVRRGLAAGSSPTSSGCACGSSRPPTSCTTSPSRARAAARSSRRSIWTPPTQPQLEELEWFRFPSAGSATYDGIPLRRLAHRLHRRARLRDLLPPRRRPGGVGRGLAGGRAARPDAARPRRARHAAHRGGPDLRRLRVRRPGRPVRGRHRLHGPLDDQRGLRRQEALHRRKAHPQRTLVGLELAGNETAGHGDCVHVGRRSQVGVITQRHAVADAAQEHRAVPDGGRSTPRSAPRSRSASSTATRSASRRPSCGSRSTTRRRSARGADRRSRAQLVALGLRAQLLGEAPQPLARRHRDRREDDVTAVRRDRRDELGAGHDGLSKEERCLQGEAST